MINSQISKGSYFLNYRFKGKVEYKNLVLPFVFYNVEKILFKKIHIDKGQLCNLFKFRKSMKHLLRKGFINHYSPLT